MIYLPRGRQETAPLGLPRTPTAGWRVAPEAVQPSNETGHDYPRLGLEGSQGGHAACCGGPAWPCVAGLRGSVRTSFPLPCLLTIRHGGHTAFMLLQACRTVVKIDGTLMGKCGESGGMKGKIPERLSTKESGD